MEKDVKVVEKIEDICVMEGINFRLNQRISRIEDEIRKEKIKKRKRERFNNTLLSICITIASIITILLIITLGYLVFKDTDKDIQQCIDKGYSKPYCEKAILGN